MIFEGSDKISVWGLYYHMRSYSVKIDSKSLFEDDPLSFS